MVANEARDSFNGVMNHLSLATSQNEESNAHSRWESEGGKSQGLQRLAANEEFVIPILGSTEQAIIWGSHLNAEQHTTLVKTQRALSKHALVEGNMQRMVDLATQSQLLREAAEAFVPAEHEVI
jgi:hypothetical protein